MKRVLRWIGVGLASVAGLVIVAYAVVYVLSERVLRHTYAVPAVAITIPTDPARSSRERRLATVRGCFGGCHGKQAEGMVMFDQPMIGRVVAPNLTAAVRKYSDAELVAIIRNGVRPGGRSLMVMPSEAYVLLTDDDLGRIIAFLRSLPVVEGPGPSVSLGPLGRIGGCQPTNSSRWRSSSLKRSRHPRRPSEQAARGRYLARTTCAAVPRDRACAAIPIPISPVRVCGWWPPILRKHSRN